jgi:hypothetical protein
VAAAGRKSNEILAHQNYQTRADELDEGNANLGTKTGIGRKISTVKA